MPFSLEGDEEGRAMPLHAAASSGDELYGPPRRWPRSSGTLLGAVGLVAVGALFGAAAQARHQATASPAMRVTSLWGWGWGADDHTGACPLPEHWCKESATRKDKLSYRDCDGDGILDPYCEGGELLRFGYLSSKNKCHDNWPNGLCAQEVEPDRDPAKTAAGNEITVIHFNDVYQVAGVLEGHIRRGGMSRAAEVIKRARARNPDRTFVVFAGDLLSPSVLSDLFEGEQMVDILNTLGLDAASLGNHEFDFGVDTLAKRVKQSDFPWLNINLMDEHGQLLEGTTERFIRTVPFNPWFSNEKKEARVCLFGSAYDVRMTMFKDTERITHKDAINASLKEADYLRNEKSCDVVLAMTHQFSRFDCKMSGHLGNKIDLILGGHDHSTEYTTVCGHAPYAKADSDLKTQWVMTLWLDDEGKVNSVDGQLLSLTDADPFDEEIHDKVVEWEEKGEKEMGVVIGSTTVKIDCRAKEARQHETNSGVFFTDSVKSVHRTDVVLINGGTIRGNVIFPVGPLDKKTLTAMHPFGNKIVKIHASGKQIRDYIETTLNCYQDTCGDFVQVSGLRYTFDPSAKPGQRLKRLQQGEGSKFSPVGDDDMFTVAISDFMLANSNMKNNKLYKMVTLNDAVPLVDSLYTAVKAAGKQGIAPKVDGRIVKL